MGTRIDRVIADWKRAYEMVNGFAPRDTIEYVRGWIVFKGVTGFVTRRRVADVQAMTDRLCERAADRCVAP